MVDTLHENGIKVLLWQLPVIKSASQPIEQLATDEAYAIAQGYVLDDSTGTPYRNKGGWYGNAVMPDFTNSAATNWWMSKRAYLLNEIGIDGFKCDGGEFVWGRNITASNGMKGDELRNLYPDLYVQAYSDFVKDYKTDGIVFFRAGGAGAGQHPIAWVGDQTSSFSAYRDAIRATMNASMSGVPMMRSMAYEFPGDTTAESMEFQYMLGENLLVAPLENEGQTEKLIYLPDGEWIDLFWGAKRPGGSLITYTAGLDAIPVFVKAGSVLPLNLNADYAFGESVGNSVENYVNLTFRIYPHGTTHYDYYDYVADAQVQLTVQENYANGRISVQLPAMTSARRSTPPATRSPSRPRPCRSPFREIRAE